MNLFSKNKNVIVKNNSLVMRIIEFILGCFVVAISYNLFIAPNKLVPGGVGGIAIIVNGLTNNVLKPVINWFLATLLGSDSLSEIYTYLKKVEVPELDASGAATGKMVVDLTQSIYIDWGAFINAIINFLIIAFVLFTIVKMINKINETSKKMSNIKNKIAFKRENGIKLTKKEVKFLEEEAKKEAEAKAKAEAEAKAKAEEEANKVIEPSTNDLLKAILEELKK